MDNKYIKFNAYRYHLLPLDNKNNQLKIEFNKTEKISFEDVKKNKNLYFDEALKKIESNNSDKNILKVVDKVDDLYLIKFSNKKFEKIIDENLKNSFIESNPYVYVIINNNPKVQKIYVSTNFDAFSTINFSISTLITIIRKYLAEFSLNIQFDNLFDKKDFWTIINNNKNSITGIQFEIIKPNLSNISGSLKDVLKEVINDHNSHKTKLSLNAPQNGILNNIDKSHSDISGIVDYASEGGGNIKVKVKGSRVQLDTKQNLRTIEIDELSLESGSLNQITSFFKDLLK
ncbi:hypothetical protein ACTS95_14795 [Empedobacter brevis]